MNITFDKVKEFIMLWDNILLLTHRSPDGDTLGSAYALESALLKINKKVYVLNNGEVSKKYDFLLKDRAIMPKEFKPDYIISIDTADLSMLGTNAQKYKGKIDLCIDHHISNSGFAKHTYVDASAAATGEIIYDLILALGIPLDTNMARDIYVSIVSDTGCFKFSNTTPKTLITASELIKFGFGFTPLVSHLFDKKSKAQINLKRLILDTLEFYDDDKIALITITSEMMKETGTSSEDIEGFAQLPRHIEGTAVGITFKQSDEKLWRVSLRSNGDIDASKVCGQFGGGGHLRAAGCEIEGEINQVKIKMIDAVIKFTNTKKL